MTLPTAVLPDAVIAVRAVIALVFLSAAVGKMRHWHVFQGVVANYRLLPHGLITPVAYGLPLVEVVIGAALFTGLAAPTVEVVAAALLGLFAAAMGVNLVRGRRHIDCGCFQGVLRQPLRWALVARNLIMALLLVAAAAADAARADAWSVVNGLLAGGALFVIVQSLNTLWAIAPRDGRGRARSMNPSLPGAI